MRVLVTTDGSRGDVDPMAVDEDEGHALVPVFRS